MKLFELFGVISLKDNDVEKKLEGVGKRAKMTAEQCNDLGKKCVDLSKKLKWVSAGAGAALGGMVKYASDMGESMNKVEVAFGNSSKAVEKFATTTLEKFGIAKGTALDMAAGFGDMGTSMGLTQKNAAEMSTSLVGLAGDLASFKNMSIDETTTALNGIFTGETESLKRLGVVMTETNLEAYALANGFGKTYKEMTQAEKVQLRYQYVMDATKNAHGDFANTLNDSTANQLRVFKESVKELAASFGQVLLPIVIAVMKPVNAFMKIAAKASDGTKKFVAGILAITAAAAPALFIFGKLMLLKAKFIELGGAAGIVSKAGKAVSGAIGSIGMPVIATVAAIAALIAIFVHLYKTNEDFRKSVQKAWAQIKDAIAPVIESLQQLIGTLWDGILKPFIAWIGSSILPAVVAVIKIALPFITGAFTGIAEGVNGVIQLFNGLLKVTKTIFVGVKNAIVNPLQTAQNMVNKIFQKIKKIFSTVLKINIKVPKITIDGGKAPWGIGGKGKKPNFNVTWNKDGAIFSKPTIFATAQGLQGVGEAGAEAVAPISKLQEYVAQAVASQNAALLQGLRDIMQDQSYTFNIATQIDGKTAAESMATYTQDALNKMRARNNRLAGVR